MMDTVDSPESRDIPKNQTSAAVWSVLDGLYENLNKHLGTPEGTHEAINAAFKSAEQEITGLLKTALKRPGIQVELSADDETELYDGDWNGSCYMVISEGENELGKVDFADVLKMDQFIAQHTEPNLLNRAAADDVRNTLGNPE